MKSVIAPLVIFLLTACGAEEVSIRKSPTTPAHADTHCMIFAELDGYVINCADDSQFIPQEILADMADTEKVQVITNTIIENKIAEIKTGTQGTCEAIPTDEGVQILCGDDEGVVVHHGRDGKDGADGKDGKDGRDGKDGTSCKVEDHPAGAVVKCSDGSEEIIYDGKDGRDGKDGTNGSGGSECTVKPHPQGAEISCDDGSSQVIRHGQDGSDGADGKDGVNGTNGKDGRDGKDGIDGTSCSVQQTSSGAKVKCDDGTEATLNHGRDGKDGKDGAKGKDGIDGIDGKDGTGVTLKIHPIPTKGKCVKIADGIFVENEGDYADLYNNSQCDHGPKPKKHYCDDMRDGEDKYANEICWVGCQQFSIEGTKTDMTLYELDFCSNKKTNPPKNKCNNGNGNGSEGCSPSDNGNDDEDDD